MTFSIWLKKKLKSKIIGRVGSDSQADELMKTESLADIIFRKSRLTKSLILLIFICLSKIRFLIFSSYIYA